MRSAWAAFSAFLLRRPTISFFVILGLLFGVITLAAMLRTPEIQETSKTIEPKTTDFFVVGQDQARLTVSGKIKKETTTNVVALVPSTVTTILAQPGKKVAAGQTLALLSNDYGSNAAGIQVRITETSDAFIQRNYDLNRRINELEQKQARRDPDSTDLQESIELKKLKEERRRLALDRDNSALSSALARANAAVFQPKSFTSGVVERVHVKRGQYVAPGTVLFSLRSAEGAMTIEALVSREVAKLFDPETPAQLTLENGEWIDILPTFFSLEETTSGLFSLLFTLSPAIRDRVVDASLLTLSLPLTAEDEQRVLVPIDSVFQSTGGATTLVEHEGKAAVRSIELGRLYGSFAEVLGGLSPGDHIILNRSVVANDAIVGQAR